MNAGLVVLFGAVGIWAVWRILRWIVRSVLYHVTPTDQGEILESRWQ